MCMVGQEFTTIIIQDRSLLHQLIIDQHQNLNLVQDIIHLHQIIMWDQTMVIIIMVEQSIGHQVGQVVVQAILQLDHLEVGAVVAIWAEAVEVAQLEVEEVVQVEEDNLIK